ncbi:MAG TPA: RagB/SusD family nutrient uptake outer membrane protein, partial [Niastella sp.]
SDVVVLRYADVLLMLAETENETKDTIGAAKHLNEIRTRAALAATTAVTQVELTKAIELERRLELVGEGHRWFDLLRTGMALTTMNAWFAANGINITINKDKLVMPVPQNQIDTDPTIRQNDNY